jgi:hypothetical protein
VAFLVTNVTEPDAGDSDRLALVYDRLHRPLARPASRGRAVRARQLLAFRGEAHVALCCAPDLCETAGNRTGREMELLALAILERDDETILCRAVGSVSLCQRDVGAGQRVYGVA